MVWALKCAEKEERKLTNRLDRVLKPEAKILKSERERSISFQFKIDLVSVKIDSRTIPVKRKTRHMESVN